MASPRTTHGLSGPRSLHIRWRPADFSLREAAEPVLRAAVLDRIPPDRPCDLADVYRDLVDEGLLSGYEATRRFYEIGSPAGLAEAQRYLASRAAVAPR